MKEVQDYYFKKAQREGYPARSVYKLEEAQHKYGFLKRGQRVLDLGGYPGSWSMYSAKTVGDQGLVVAVDLQSGRRRQESNRAPIEFVRGDIMRDETLAAIERLAPNFQVVLSDMAPQTTGSKWADHQKSLVLCRQALDLARRLLVPGGAFYCKVFDGEDFKEFFEQTKRDFRQTKIVKPKSSRPESRELFVLGLEFVGQADKKPRST
ncbi:MAG: RlmE family RNA methyltransferase [Desulfobacteraceae bacterium]|nr:RlmE family RNA methyltransferase [Desulfobacteraceae bacterium]